MAMATKPTTDAERIAEFREYMRQARERNAKHRENVLRHAANLGRIAEKLRARAR
jgi:hypothetical protein